jgi:hypothetical protein
LGFISGSLFVIFLFSPRLLELENKVIVGDEALHEVVELEGVVVELVDLVFVGLHDRDAYLADVVDGQEGLVAEEGEAAHELHYFAPCSEELLAAGPAAVLQCGFVAREQAAGGVHILAGKLDRHAQHQEQL